MPEVELPLQAAALETLVSDVRRMRYPPHRDWFQARAALTKQYLEAFREAGSPFPGEKGRPSRVELNQDNGDKLAQGIVSHWHRQYDFRGHVDMIDAQGLSYGAGVGRLRMVNRRVLGHDARVNAKEKNLPVLVPRDIKKVYLDDSQHALMHEGIMLGPNIIQERTIQHSDLAAAAAEDDTYIASEITRLKPDKRGDVLLLELEGDLVFDQGSTTIIEQDVVVTVAVAGKAGALVRVQEGQDFSTYIVHQYHVEGPQFTYGSSPLMKGMPIAKAAAQALNRVIESGLLKNSPPIQYSPDDPYFVANGGPQVYPNALWAATDDVKVQKDVGGDTNVLFGIFGGLVQMYSDVTGVTPARLGAQTKSHTTAFAKDVELNQGASRTVDYVTSTLDGPMTRFLELEYRMGLAAMSGRENVYIQEWNEFVEIKKGHLPSVVKFFAVGAGAPAEEEARIAEKLASAQQALQIDQIAVQLGNESSLDHAKLIEQVLSEGGWDVSAILAEAEVEPTDQGQLPGILSSGIERVVGI